MTNSTGISPLRQRMTDELRAVPHGEEPRSQFDYELAWVRIYLKKVGAMENSERGVWRLTPVGAAMSEAELAAVPRRVREVDRQRRLERETAPEIEAALRQASRGTTPVSSTRNVGDQFLGDEPANGGAKDFMLFRKQFAWDHGTSLVWRFCIDAVRKRMIIERPDAVPAAEGENSHPSRGSAAQPG